MTSLGEKLRQQNEERDAAANATEQRKREESALKYNSDNSIIANRLKSIQADIVFKIANNQPIKAVKLPQPAPWNTYSFPRHQITGVKDAKISLAGHPHRNTLVTFFEWADENGMTGIFNYEWDGGGMDSWFTVTVEPKLRNEI